MKLVQQPASASLPEERAGFVSDFLVLTKARLTTLVLTTTCVGFILAAQATVQWMLLVNALIGTALVAGGASVLNQLLERGADRLMERTKDRPLATGRLDPHVAWIMGLALATAGLSYLVLLVNARSALLAGLTLFVYVVIYTPCKRISSVSTLLGAVSGALPPVIGWVAAGGAIDAGAWFLFGLLFFWQLPHFIAINWLYRTEYERAGFVMWSNGDASGHKSARLALGFSVTLLGWTMLPLVPPWTGLLGVVYAVGAVFLGVAMVGLSVIFCVRRRQSDARLLFFYTLIYLPLILGLMLAGRT